MFILSRRLWIGVALLLALTASTAATDEKTVVPPPSSGPATPEHARLKQFVGTWEATVKAYGLPDKPPQESKGTDVRRLGCGGLWLIEDFRSEFMGRPFEGHGVIGYDPAKKKYVGTWVDALQTSMLLTDGSFDSSGKIFTQTGEGPDMTGKVVKYKMVTEIKDDDRQVFTTYVLGADGKDTRTLEIAYQRKK